MKKNYNKKGWLIGALFLVAVLSATAVAAGFIKHKNNKKASSDKTSQENVVLVTRVIDGDTIEIAGGKKVRYIGIDTPETVDPRKPVQCFGEEASKENKKLVEGKRVRLEGDVSETDKYGRLLKYVYLGNLFVNDYLVRQGYGYAYTFPPDIKYAKEFVQAQREARKAKRGLWAACQNQGSIIASTTLEAKPLSYGCISIQKAEDYVGERKCVAGKVYRVFTSSTKITFLDFCQNYKTCPFSVVVFSSNLPNFSNLKQYEGKMVEVNGLIRSYRGRTEIVLSGPDQIKILETRN